jgi:hypothetical protein
MPFVSIHQPPGSEVLRIVVSEERAAARQMPGEEGTFVPSPDPVLFQREVPDTRGLLDRIGGYLASSRVAGSEDGFTCPVPLAVRAIELASADLWPTRRLRCPDCQQYFYIPYQQRQRMYLACPNCHNTLLNPGWDTA